VQAKSRASARAASPGRQGVQEASVARRSAPTTVSHGASQFREPEAHKKLAGGEGSEATKNHRIRSRDSPPSVPRTGRCARSWRSHPGSDIRALLAPPSGRMTGPCGSVDCVRWFTLHRSAVSLHHRLISCEPPARDAPTNLWQGSAVNHRPPSTAHRSPLTAHQWKPLETIHELHDRRRRLLAW